MRVVVIGCGYVGLVSGACFAEFGFEVTCIDKDSEKISALRGGVVSLYEPGLDEIVSKNSLAGRLIFDDDLSAWVAGADVVLFAVGTPERRGDGHADLAFVYEAAEQVAEHLSGYTLLVTKSTVPIGTGRKIESIIKKAKPSADIDVVSNPEFLREGSAIEDFMRPDRIIVGADSERAKEMMRQLYRPLYIRETPILFTTLETAELIKYAANAFLAMKISYINQMADLCEVVGADIHDVAKGIGLDKRIGAKFLHPGPGYGGSCFPKDTLALVKTAEEYSASVSLVEEVVRYNAERKKNMAKRIIKAAGGSVKGKKIAVLGLSFKPETDDMRESSALTILPQLLKAGAKVSAYDPVAIEKAKPLLPKAIDYAKSAKDCLKGAEVLVVLTEWNEFRALTPSAIKKAMSGKVVVDLRNIYEPSAVSAAGLEYYGIGRGHRQGA